jgi:hypothetical protein
MDGIHFDQIARDQSVTGSRRQTLKLLAAGLLAPVLAHLGPRETAAACRKFNQQCSANAPCCPGTGMRCQDGRCRCRNGRRRCAGAGPTCVKVSNHPKHCGRCGHKCPAHKPCCFDGKCRPKCGTTCCKECFVEMLPGVATPVSHVCCGGGEGTICSRKPGRKDDRCCYPNEVCIKGKCCTHGFYGAKVCGGKCCARTACCGKTCCKKGQVCVRKGGKRVCAPANRACTTKSQCFANEICHGGKCCSGNRICHTDLGATPICCKANEYCEFPGGTAARCSPVGTTVSTSRGHRIRP